MKVLGKVAFVPVIASGMIAGGAGAGVAMAASTPAAHGNAVTPDDPTRNAIGSTTMYQSLNSNAMTVGYVAKGDTLDCTASQMLSDGETFFHCADITTGLAGWIPAAATSYVGS